MLSEHIVIGLWSDQPDYIRVFLDILEPFLEELEQDGDDGDGRTDKFCTPPG